MRLVAARVQKVMSVIDSGVLELDDAVTVLVGKNESGKTAMLRSLYRANPLSSGHATEFSTRRDFPRRLLSSERETMDDVQPVAVQVELEPEERALLASRATPGPLPEGPLWACRRYGDQEVYWRTDPDSPTTIDVGAEVTARLTSLLPGIQYFDDHNVLPGSVSIRRLQKQDPADLSPSERTALSLLRLAGVDDQPFDEDDYETRKAALETAAADLSDQLLEYWSQNRDLSIELDLESYGGGEPYLHIRVRDDRQRMSLNVAERSKGFIWFFSFLAAFSEFADDDSRVVLLDEPGMNLHANAQTDLLRFIKERLAPRHQVIYSTHSPYLIDANHLDRVRTLENVAEVGTQVTADIWRAQPETTVPLLAALGASMTRRLVTAPHQLLVSSPSDVVYLTAVGDLLRSQGGRALDPRWTLTPVGGASGLPTFVALLGGTTLTAAVLLDGPSDAAGDLSELVQRGVLTTDRLVPITDITGTYEADVEDLFESGWYLTLLRECGVGDISPRKLRGRRFFRKPPRRRVVEQVGTALGRPFDRYQPAGHLLRERSTVLASLDRDSKERFQTLIDRLNTLL